jgi:hypothetical protein
VNGLIVLKWRETNGNILSEDDLEEVLSDRARIEREFKLSVYSSSTSAKKCECLKSPDVNLLI